LIDVAPNWLLRSYLSAYGDKPGHDALN